MSKEKLLADLAALEQEEKDLDDKFETCRDKQVMVREQLWNLQSDSFKEGDKIVNARGQFAICKTIHVERSYNDKKAMRIASGYVGLILKGGKVSEATRRIYSMDGWKKAPQE